MPSIVVALDEPYRERIEEAAGEIKAVTGRKDLASAARPHFTLHVAGRYRDGIDAALAAMVDVSQGIEFETGRVGVFRGPETIVALEVVRTEELMKFHASLLECIVPFADDPKLVYASQTWAPHISIVAGNIAPEHADAITAVLALRDFAWHVPLTNICLVPDERAREWTRFDVRS